MRAHVEVVFRFLFGDFFYSATDADLALEFFPMEDDRCEGVLVEILAFLRAVVGEKAVSIVVKVLEQDDAG